jgi:hypothetical protein
MMDVVRVKILNYRVINILESPLKDEDSLEQHEALLIPYISPTYLRLLGLHDDGGFTRKR